MFAKESPSKKERQKTLDRRGESQERTRTARDRRAIGPTERAERTRRNRLQFHQVSEDFRRGGGRSLPRPDAASVPAKQKGRQRKRGGGGRPSRRASIGRDRRRAVASPSSGPPTNLPAPRPSRDRALAFAAPRDANRSCRSLHHRILQARRRQRGRTREREPKMPPPIDRVSALSPLSRALCGVFEKDFSPDTGLCFVV